MIRRSILVLGLVAVLFVTGGVAAAQVPPAPGVPPTPALPQPPPGVVPQVPPPGVVPAPPAVPPASLPPEAAPAGEAASVPAAVVCSLPGGVTSIARFAAALGGLTDTIDVDAASPWFMPIYSACVAVPVPTNPMQCEPDRMLRANGYGPNGLPITIYFPDPVGTAVTPVEVAEREAADNGAALPVSPTETAAGPLACEKFEMRAAATEVPALPVPDVGGPAVAAASPAAVASVGGAGGAVNGAGGSFTIPRAGAVDGVAVPAAASVAGAAGQVAVGGLPASATGTAPGGNTPLQNLIGWLAALIGVVTVILTVYAKRTAPPQP